VPQVEEGRAIFRQACVSAEFRAFAANESSPVTTWLRALARLAHRECGGPGVARRPLRRTRPARQRRQPRHPAVLRTRGVLMAPNAAPFTDDALAKVTVPVLVYAAEKDDLTRDPDGFDRDALHEVMNREIVDFSTTRYRRPGARSPRALSRRHVVRVSRQGDRAALSNVCCPELHAPADRGSRRTPRPVSGAVRRTGGTMAAHIVVSSVVAVVRGYQLRFAGATLHMGRPLSGTTAGTGFQDATTSPAT
jgi:hypothetical protein